MTLDENCLLCVQRDINLRNKVENCDGTDFKMGVAATLSVKSYTAQLKFRKSLRLKWGGKIKIELVAQ